MKNVRQRVGGKQRQALLDFVNDELFPALKELPAKGAQANRARVVKSVFEDAYNYMKSGTLLRQVINKITTIADKTEWQKLMAPMYAKQSKEIQDFIKQIQAVK